MTTHGIRLMIPGVYTCLSGNIVMVWNGMWNLYFCSNLTLYRFASTIANQCLPTQTIIEMVVAASHRCSSSYTHPELYSICTWGSVTPSNYGLTPGYTGTNTIDKIELVLYSYGVAYSSPQRYLERVWRWQKPPVFGMRYTLMLAFSIVIVLVGFETTTLCLYFWPISFRSAFSVTFSNN
jgi:hypothetical protein